MLCTLPGMSDLKSLNVLMLSLGNILESALVGGLDPCLILSLSGVSWGGCLGWTWLNRGGRLLSRRRIPTGGGRGASMWSLGVLWTLTRFHTGFQHCTWQLGRSAFQLPVCRRGTHTWQSPISYSNGGNWGYGSFGMPPDPALCDEGTLVHPVGVLSQSETAIGAGAVVETFDLGADATGDSLAGELMVLMALRSRSWFLRRLLPALAFQREQRIMGPQMSTTTPKAEAPEAKLAIESWTTRRQSWID